LGDYSHTCPLFLPFSNVFTFQSNGAALSASKALTKNLQKTVNWLVVSTNPFEKYDRQNGNLPQIGVTIKKN